VRLEWHMRFFCSVALLLGISGFASAQTLQQRPAEQIPRSTDPTTPQTKNQKAAEKERQESQAPRDPNESSSKDTIIDISPPKDDAKNHPESFSSPEEDTSGVMEVKKWDPHKAEKDVEVGDYYLKQKNYVAAISRYREALEYKPRDAVATFRLAQALEKSGESQEALQNYQEYLRILKNGPFAAEAKKGVERMQQKSQRSSKD
jgi:tetratricopeptide (TPR) repeat protein